MGQLCSNTSAPPYQWAGSSSKQSFKQSINCFLFFKCKIASLLQECRTRFATLLNSIVLRDQERKSAKLASWKSNKVPLLNHKSSEHRVRQERILNRAVLSARRLHKLHRKFKTAIANNFWITVYHFEIGRRDRNHHRSKRLLVPLFLLPCWNDSRGTVRQAVGCRKQQTLRQQHSTIILCET